MKKNKFYITTAIAYTNAGPHLGHALEFIQADVLARYHRLQGQETWLLTGTDEHGTKISRTAEAQNKEPQVFVDEIVPKFESLLKALNVTNDDFIRTSDRTRHWPAAQKIWETLAEKGDLYKKNYEGYYCVGHEAFIKKSELVDGLCSIHKTEPEMVIEENWFFRLSKYTQEIKEKIKTDELKILPVSKKNEILNLLDDAEDVSFSRPSKDLKWGIPVPNDPTQTMYVWADALTNYISALGWAHDGDDFQKFWPADIHLIGKDILRFHAMIWPAMLMSASIELPKAIYVHGFVTSSGEKMSKSLGNVVDPFSLVQKYGVDVVRYFLLREIPSDEDGDFSEEKLKSRYNGDLANGLGNLVQRATTLIETGLDGKVSLAGFKRSEEAEIAIQRANIKVQAAMNEFKLNEALSAIWELIKYADGYFSERKPWATLKTDKKDFEETMVNITDILNAISHMLAPFMPATAEKVPHFFSSQDQLGTMPESLSVSKGSALFPRLD